jgi:hypothetical protein
VRTLAAACAPVSVAGARVGARPTGGAGPARVRLLERSVCDFVAFDTDGQSCGVVGLVGLSDEISFVRRDTYGMLTFDTACVPMYGDSGCAAGRDGWCINHSKRGRVVEQEFCLGRVGRNRSGVGDRGGDRDLLALARAVVACGDTGYLKIGQSTLRNDRHSVFRFRRLFLSEVNYHSFVIDREAVAVRRRREEARERKVTNAIVSCNDERDGLAHVEARALEVDSGRAKITETKIKPILLRDRRRLTPGSLDLRIESRPAIQLHARRRRCVG